MEVLIAKKEELEKYDGFIAPNGDFYIVSKKNKHIPTHFQWADYFVVNKTNYIKNLANPSNSFLYTISRLKTKQDILIHFYGFIYYGHDIETRKPILIYPNYDINNMEITNSQYEVLWEILSKNNELSYYPCNFTDECREKKHDDYVINYIENLEGRYKHE